MPDAPGWRPVTRSAPWGALGGAPAASDGIDARSGPRRVHRPELDGLRGLAVAAVVAYHLEPDMVPGGYLGVDLFFVLSGYLITSLLLEEWASRGRVDLAGFAARRVRRLFPALVLLVPIVVALEAVAGDPGLLDQTRRHALATLGYVANWVLVGDGDSYFDAVSGPSPFRHAWSLAVEEQFYLVWPALILLSARVAGRRGVTLAAVAVAGASLVAMAVHADPTAPGRAYYGTDARLFEPLVGAVGALVLPLGAARPRWLAAPGTAALVAWVVTVLVVDDTWTGFYRGGALLVSLLGLVLLLGAGRGWGARLSTWGPLVALGVVSYGVYLWHWPLIVLFDQRGWSGWRLDLVVVPATLAVAALSYRIVERPIRSGRRGVAAAPWVSVGGGFAAAAAAAVVVLTLAPPRSGETVVGLEATLAGTDARPLVALVGDSTAWTLGGGRVTPGDDQGPYDSPFDGQRLVLANLARKGFRFRFAGETGAGPTTDDQIAASWLADVDRLGPDVIVAVFALNDLATPGITPSPSGPGPRLLHELAQRAPLLVVGPPPVVAADLPDADAAAFFAEAGAELNARFSHLLEDLAAGDDRITFVDLGAWMCPGPGAGVPTRDACRVTPSGGPLRYDGVHYSPEGAREVAAWLQPRILAMASG
ncbi:MAG: hypothetical protein D6683_17795 [Actinomyces sp.]|nr:MAG: hypothetical protein D6683_17795 [Actinomyces sp.]